ncbi:MAG: MFS transporter, partial [Pirellulales bacterium]
LTLPHTVPPSKGKKVTLNEVFGLDALVLLKRPSFAIFMFSSFLICIPLAFYYQLAGKFVDAAGLANPAFKMSFGQMSEVVFMLVMPLFFARLGVKWMLFVGMFAWVVRYGLFAAAADDGIAWMVLSGILLHGICYDFFFVTGQIYTDKSAPKEIRGQAQGMLVLFTLGLGMAIGAQCAGYIEPLFTVQGEEKTALDEQANAIGGQMQKLQDELDRLEGRKFVIDDQGNPVTDADGQPQEVNYLVSQWRLMFPAPATEANAQQARQVGAELATLREQRSEVLLQVVDWKTLWAIPAGFAFVVMIGFAVFFKTDVPEGEVSEGQVADADAKSSLGGP